MTGLHLRMLEWYDGHARELPWRDPSATAWAVLVSEFMLQQTPVHRVLPVFNAWMLDWPAPADLAAAPLGSAIRAWGRLGYPRRAVRLHQTAGVIVERHGGDVPSSTDDLLALPGVGAYTAAAVASFAFGQRQIVLDTNVRRVLSRCIRGEQHPPRQQTRSEMSVAVSAWPDSPEVSSRWAVAVMELGALVCLARNPRCEQCPIADLCAWRAAGSPPGPARRSSPPWDGTDRQCRGAIMAVIRSAHGPLTSEDLAHTSPDADQRERCLGGLAADGLLVAVNGPAYVLPGADL